MENIKKFYKNKKVLVTGATGFKGAWLTVWLLELGAKIHGFSDQIPTNPSAFEALKLSDKISYCQALFMHQYRISKLPNSFTNIFSDISNTDELQTRDNDYNYINKPAIKRNLTIFTNKLKNNH